MPAANSIHCQSVLERSVLFNAYRLPSKLITVGLYLDLQLEDVKDIRWEICRPDNHILKFILEPQRCEKEGFGDCGADLSWLTKRAKICQYEYWYNDPPVLLELSSIPTAYRDWKTVVSLLNNEVYTLYESPNHELPRVIFLP
jgi:hypothetical protein